MQPLIRLLTLFAIIALGGCHPGQDSKPKSSWTIDGVTYNEGSVPTTFSPNVLFASDDLLHGNITIHFGSKPIINSDFIVANFSDTSALKPGTNCSIEVTTTTSKDFRSSPGTCPSGGCVHVSIGASGKLTATFSNVLMKENTNASNTKFLAGTLIEQ
jgi:hypothetical protein